MSVMCDNCDDKPATATLKLREAIYCCYEDCGALLYARGEVLNLCGVRKVCKNLYWTVVDSMIDGSTVKMQLVMEKSGCGSCGRRNNPSGTFVGQIRPVT